MNQERLLTDWLADLADAIDDGGPVNDSILLGMPFLLADGEACEASFQALGFNRQGAMWVRGNERYTMKNSDYISIDIPAAEIEGIRITLLHRAEKYGVVIYIPDGAQVSAMGIAPAYHPVKKMLVEAPNLRLLFAPGANQRSELADLLACRAIDWPRAVRISLEGHASYPVSPNAQANLEATLKVILRETNGTERLKLLEELAMRYGRTHEIDSAFDIDTVFQTALEPYLYKSFLHE